MGRKPPSLKKMARRRSQKGYTLIEMVLVLVIIATIATVGLKSLTAVHQTSRFEETRQELDRLAAAIVGDPSFVSGGSRTDFGYVGDVGSLPPNLDALVTNPGGYATWDGPYLGDDFSTDGSSSTFKIDAWGAAYSYSGGVTVASTGGATGLTRKLANAMDDLLYNNLSAVVTDLNRTPPGTTYQDSVRLVLTYPDGAGGLAIEVMNPRTDGLVQFDSIPIGIHELRVVYIPTSDTLTRKVVVNPGNHAYTEISLAEDVWSGS